MNTEIGLVGLGKMGANIARNLYNQGYTVAGFDIDTDRVDTLAEEDVITAAYSIEDVADALEPPRIIWLSVPKGDPVDDSLESLADYLEEGDTVIDGGNSDFRNAERRYQYLQEHGINFLDAGCSGGPSGARNGMSIMVGGDESVFNEVEDVFDALSVEDGYGYFGAAGTGHMVKNVHNGIEYGMMEAIAEGLELLAAEGVDPEKAASVWSNGSVIESFLTACMEQGFDEFGTELDGVSGKVPQGGTGRWTVEAGEERGIDMPAIAAAVEVRDRSLDEPSYRGRMLRAMRHIFGGHPVTEEDK